MTSPTAFERLVSASLTRAGLPDGGNTLVVGASGGPDSTALLACLSRLSDRHDLALHVAHLNHDFRGAEADHDAAFVQHLADGLGLPCSIEKRDPIAYQREHRVSSFEQAAREMRYTFLSAVAASVNATAVALGHTADDQAETVLQHLLRGSGLHGLRGMAELVPWPWPEPNPGPLLFRPLLGVGKADAASYCRSIGRTFREDSGNYMWRFTRNRVRLDLMPRLARDYNPRVREALTRLSSAAAEDLDFIEGEVSHHWPNVARELEGAVSFDADSLSALHPSLQRHALRRAYVAVAGDPRGLGDAHVHALLSLLEGDGGTRALHLPRGIVATIEYGSLHIERGQHEETAISTLEGEHLIRLPTAVGQRVDTTVANYRVSMVALAPAQSSGSFDGEGTAYAANLAIDALGSEAVIRTRRPGDRFQPSGMTGSKKLQDFFTDAKTPRQQRDNIPLLVCERGIAWVAGHRVAEWATADAGVISLRVSFVPVEPSNHETKP